MDRSKDNHLIEASCEDCMLVVVVCLRYREKLRRYIKKRRFPMTLGDTKLKMHLCRCFYTFSLNELGFDIKHVPSCRYQKKAAKLTQEFTASANEVEYDILAILLLKIMLP